MKKHLQLLNKLFKKQNNRSTLLDDLKNRKTIATPYSAALINGSFERGSGIKMSTVYVTTVEPEVVFPSFSAWMLNIQCERALISEEIGLIGKNEILKDAVLYKTGVKGYRTIKNNKL